MREGYIPRLVTRPKSIRRVLRSLHSAYQSPSHSFFVAWRLSTCSIGIPNSHPTTLMCRKSIATRCPITNISDFCRCRLQTQGMRNHPTTKKSDGKRIMDDQTPQPRLASSCRTPKPRTKECALRDFPLIQNFCMSKSPSTKIQMRELETLCKLFPQEPF